MFDGVTEPFTRKKYTKGKISNKWIRFTIKRSCAGLRSEVSEVQNPSQGKNLDQHVTFLLHAHPWGKLQSSG